MSKHTPLFEWQVAPDDAEWPIVAIPTPLGAPATTALDATAHWYTRRWLWGGILTLLLLASAGGWLWRTAQAGLDQIEGELSSTMQTELVSARQILDREATRWRTDPTDMIWQAQMEREGDTLHNILPPDIPETQLATDIKTIDLQDDQVVAEFVTTLQDGTEAYRQTRFYRQTAGGWQRTQPDAALWGSPRHLESTHFTFHFRRNDAEAVAVVAPQMDALYEELQRNYGLSPSTDKPVIEVTVERAPGVIVTPQWEHVPLVVPSPALYFAPIELSDSAILAQSIALPLINHMGKRAIEEHTVPLHWWPLFDSLQLWQLWDVEMPLAHWRDDVVTWLFADIPRHDSGRRSVLPDTYSELCGMHNLWMQSPVLLGIPLECIPSNEGTWTATQWSTLVPLLPHTRIDQLRTPRIGDYQFEEEAYLVHSTNVVIMATLIEYAVATYGYETLPALLAALSQHDTWDSLLPAVFGVSYAEFEESWQAHLAKGYGVRR